jgi:non-canonical poly(A) RNA polymerase PAPD5/7
MHHARLQTLEQLKVPSKMQVIAKARVPIIKMQDALTSIHVDISFNMEGGPAEAERIQNYLTEYPPLRPLTMIIKQFLAQRGLNEVYTGGLGSYAVLLMTMSFLQRHPDPCGA